jgi:hypothetical protein
VEIHLAFGGESLIVRSMDRPIDGQSSTCIQECGLAALQTKADLGNADAQYDLGAHYYRASLDTRRLGAPESRIEAYKWIHLAAVQGYRNALAVCEGLILAMSHAEFEEGNRRAAAFAARKPDDSPRP